ncbi:hypothetical protein D5S17_21820 [Pseudonocardiaceae bacterium YIM PH 21723]|nr:hypothetical protein D5S17_21820 [Pseudonocardiaceae bacterium YIM PH 21723]
MLVACVIMIGLNLWPRPVSAADPGLLAKAAAPQAKLGVAVYDLHEQAMLTTINPDMVFDAQSVLKLLIAMDRLEQNPDDDGAGIARMLSRSDDDVANELWFVGGQDEILRRMAGRIGLRESTGPDRSGFWGDSDTTAADQVRIYRYLLSRPYAGQLLAAMAHPSRAGLDGTDQYFGIPDAAAGRLWAVKQGWADDFRQPGPDTDYRHSTGIVDDRYIVIVLSKGTRDPRQVTEVAKAVIPAVT